MQARARGGADVAVGDSALSMIENPATLALWRVHRFDFGGEILIPQLRWSSPLGEAHALGIHPLSDMAVAVPIDDRLTLGLAMHCKCGMGTHYEMRHLLMPWTKRDVMSDLKNGGLMLGAGHRLTDKLSIGAGASVEMATARFNSVLGPADVSFGRGYAYGGSFNVGLHYQATERLALGLGYRSPSWFGDVSGGEMKASMFGVMPIHLGSVRMEDFRLPQRISGGVAWDATDWLKLVGEARWVNYSNSTFGSTTVRLKDLGIGIPMPLGYRDQGIFIVGAEFKLAERWKLGVGYNYATNPIPDEHLFPIMPATIQHHATIGLRYERDNWWAGVGYICGFNASVDNRSRYSAIPLGIDYGACRVDHRQHSLLFGFGFSW
ncbi:MAG: outer membrane protein transport protein [Phycisphaerae bacterium]